MRIGILGSGLLGGQLGIVFARAGHQVIFSYSRSRAKLEELARAAGPTAAAGTPAEAARQADALMLAVHWDQVDEVLKQAGELSGKVIFNGCLPRDSENTRLVVGLTSSGSEDLARRYRQARIVAVFGSIPSEVLIPAFDRRGHLPRPSLVYCGNEPSSKLLAAQLIRDIGFDPIDAGDLSVARYVEPFTLLMAELAYERTNAPEVGYRFEWFGGGGLT